MKKILSIIIAFSMLLSSNFAVFANTNFSDTKQDVDISSLSEKNVSEIYSFTKDGDKITYVKMGASKGLLEFRSYKNGKLDETMYYDENNDVFIYNGQEMKVDVVENEIIENAKDVSLKINSGPKSSSSTTCPYGSEHDYTYTSTSKIDLRFQDTIVTLTEFAISVVIAVKCSMGTGIAYGCATTVKTIWGIWTGKREVFVTRYNYKHKVMPSEWKFIASFYGDKARSDFGFSQKWFESGLSGL